MRRRHLTVCDRKRRAERLRDFRSIRYRYFGDFHIAVDSDAQLPAQGIDLVWCERLEISGDGVESDFVAQCVAILHRPQIADRQLRPTAQSCTKVSEPVE